MPTIHEILALGPVMPVIVIADSERCPGVQLDELSVTILLNDPAAQHDCGNRVGDQHDHSGKKQAFEHANLHGRIPACLQLWADTSTGPALMPRLAGL